MTSMTEHAGMGGLLQTETPVTMRPIRPGDADLIAEMHWRLSPASIYYRYLQHRIPPLEEIEQVCRLEPAQGAGFVATVQEAEEAVVGLAYYVREAPAQHQTAEPGILVEDQYQGQGIGRRLWQQLHKHAQADEIHWLRVLFEPSNWRMMRLVQGSGFAYQANADRWMSEYLVALANMPAYHDGSES